RKRFQAMEARRRASEDAKVGSKVAKLALDYGSWTPRSVSALSRANGVPGEDEEMKDIPSEVDVDGDHDADDDDDDDREEGIAELEEELRKLNEISMRESVKQTNLFRMLMKSWHA